MDEHAGGTRQLRVERTFAFVDLSGFTAYTDIHGDASAVDVLAGFRNAVRSVASQHAVRVAKWLGDGAMMVSSEPEQCVEAIIQVEQLIEDMGSPLALRAGVASGPVLLFEGDDYIGSAVNLAARLCDIARPREVIAPAATVSALMVNSSAHPIGDHDIRGFAEPVALVLLSDRLVGANNR
jgi:adenylate cyclase